MRTNSVIAGLVLVLGAAPFAAGAPLTLEQGIKMMGKPGAWIEADGALADGTLMAKEVEIHAKRDPAELEAPAIYGAVTEINRAKSTMRVLGYLVTWDATTTLKGDTKRQILSISDLQDGMGVKIEGTLQPSGAFKASKFKLQSGKVRDGKISLKEKILGPVTVVDGPARMLRILNTPIKVLEDAVLEQVVATPATP